MSKFKVSFLFSLCLSGCAGPSTPFGGLDDFMIILKSKTKVLTSAIRELAQEEGAQIKFSPDRQVFHAKYTFQVQINDPLGIPENAEFKIYYNGYDMSQKFFKSSSRHLNFDHTEVTFLFRKLKLPPHLNHNIKVFYKRTPYSAPLVASYKEPSCPIDEVYEIQNTYPFQVSQEIIQNLNSISKQQSINPALIAGLIAQESSFNPKSVSWAKAIGLTQITPLADQEIQKESHYRKWPRSQIISRYPASILKFLVQTDKVTPKDDWRLEPYKSIKGGIAYLNYLKEYWLRKDNQAFLKNYLKSSKPQIEQVILASYNYGPFRVKKAIKTYGESYLDAHKMLSAKKYIKKIKSYCYFFSKKEQKL